MDIGQKTYIAFTIPKTAYSNHKFNANQLRAVFIKNVLSFDLWRNDKFIVIYRWYESLKLWTDEILPEVNQPKEKCWLSSLQWKWSMKQNPETLFLLFPVSSVQLPTWSWEPASELKITQHNPQHRLWWKWRWFGEVKVDSEYATIVIADKTK